MSKKVLVLFAVALLLSLITAQCGPAPTPETIVETVVVEKAVVVEKEVTKEVEVEKEVVVTKEVEVEPAPERGKYIQEPVPVIAHDFGFGGEPELCDPTSPVVVPLAEGFQIQDTDSTIVDGGIALTVDYVNEKGQTFTITVHSIDGVAAREYLEEVKVCFEAIEVGPPSGIEATSLSLEGILLTSISDNVGLSLEELRTQRDEYLAASEAAGETPSLAGFLKMLGFDPNVALTDAVTRAQEEIDAALGQGLLTDGEADELASRLQSTFEEALFVDEELSIMDEEILEPKDDFDRDLSANAENVVVEVEWADAPEDGAENYSIFFAIDPTVGYHRSHWYNWKYKTYVNALLYVYRGKCGAYIYRWDGYSKYLTGTSKSASGWSSWVSASSSTNKWYRLRVYGWQSYNGYYLYGSWRGGSYSG